jgi:hypothetical protein
VNDFLEHVRDALKLLGRAAAQSAGRNENGTSVSQLHCVLALDRIDVLLRCSFAPRGEETEPQLSAAVAQRKQGRPLRGGALLIDGRREARSCDPMTESDNSPPSNSADTPTGSASSTGSFTGAEAQASAGAFSSPGLIHVSDQPRPDPPPFQRDYRQAAPPFFRDQNALWWRQAVQQSWRNSAAIPTGPIEPRYVPAEGPGQVASDASAIEEEADTLEDDHLRT